MLGTGRRPAAAAFAFGLVFAIGCGSDKPSGTVSGTVKYKSAPVAGGTVNFLGKNGAAAMAPIDDAGVYKLDGELEAGDYKVYFTPAPPEPVAPGTKQIASKKTDLPPKFKDPQTSGVSVTVKAGSNDVPVEFGS